MTRHVDGFDEIDFSASGLPYVINAGIFAQGQMIAGATEAIGHSWWIFNTGFGEADYLKMLDTQPTWILNIMYRPLVNATGAQPAVWRNSTWYRIADSSGILFDLRQLSTGHLLLRGSANETLCDFGLLGVGTWVAIQVKVTAAGFVAKLNGVQMGAGPVGVWRQPDRFTHRWDSGAGMNLDDYVLCDGQGADNNDFLPYPWFVGSSYAISTAQNQWSLNGKTTALVCVQDHLNPPSVTLYPDGDNGYLNPTSTGQVALFGVRQGSCVGRILGVALSVVAKPAVALQSLNLIVKQGTATDILANVVPVTRAVQLPGRSELDDYFTYYGIADRNPQGGTIWTQGDIDRAAWGCLSDTTDVHVTQVYVQRVVTTSPLSYECGQLGNYGY